MTITEKPLFTLTVTELTELIRSVVADVLKKEEKTSENDSKGEEHFNIEELANFLKCSKVTIHQYKKKGLPYYRVGRKVLFKRSEVLDFMKSPKSKIKLRGRGPFFCFLLCRIFFIKKLHGLDLIFSDHR
jgi:excisionase family DNA binding protein